jgi:hypothetical protein
MSLARTLGNHNAFVVNRLNISISVLSVSRDTVIGSIAPNEFFRLNRNFTADVPLTEWIDQWSEVEFARNNQMLRGVVELPLFRNWGDSESFLTDVRIAMRLGQAAPTINGVQRAINVFRVQNRAATVVRRDGSNPISLPIGTFVGATSTATMGGTLRNHWFISARTILVGGVPEWVPLYPQYSWGGQTVDDGFIDTGLFVGNMPNTLTIRTSLSTVQ